MKIKVPNGIVVWVDVDEVLVDFKGMFNKFLIEKHGKNITENYIPKDWHYAEVFPKVDDFHSCFNSLPENWAENLKKLEGASQFTHKLHEMGCRVILITHLPLFMAPYRLKNLIGHGIYFDEIYFTFGKSKSDYVLPLMKRFVAPRNKTVHHMLIDDRALNVKEFLENVPNFNLGVTLNHEFNFKDLKEMKERFPKNQLNFSSMNHSEMYKQIIKRINEIIKKDQKIADFLKEE